MAVEIEAKMRVADLGAVRAALKAVGATRVGAVVETNRFYDAPDRKLGQADQGLRLRTNADAADPARAEHVVTYKGPRQPGKFKTREELEFTTDDVAATAAVFAHLGYPLAFAFEKRRETWTLDDCEVVLDELPTLGTFVEVEGPSELAVEAVRAKLGLAAEESLQKGYASMVAEHLKASGGTELRF